MSTLDVKNLQSPTNFDLTLNANGSGSDIKFQSNGVEKASIDQDGNLVLSGTLTSTGIDDNADATAITIDSSENVGIGQAPEAWRSVQTSLDIGDCTAISSHTSSYSYFAHNYYHDGAEKYKNTGAAALMAINSDGSFVFDNAASGSADAAITLTNRLEIAADGDVSIGTTSNEARLHVNHSSNSVALMVNSAMSSSFTDNVMKIQSSQDSSNSSYKHLEVRNGGGAVLRILDGGNVINSANSYGAISDERIKQDIANASSQWDDIKNLTIRKFKLKREVNKDGESAPYQIGVVAQELENAGMSKLVTEEVPDKEDVVLHSDFGTIDGDGLFIEGEKVKAVKYSVLYMKAIKALQEAMDRIETLETKVTALEA